MSRPEDLGSARSNGDASGAGRVPSSASTSPGSSSLLRVRLDRLDLLVDVQRGQDAEPFEPGDRVAVALMPARAHVAPCRRPPDPDPSCSVSPPRPGRAPRAASDVLPAPVSGLRRGA